MQCKDLVCCMFLYLQCFWHRHYKGYIYDLLPLLTTWAFPQRRIFFAVIFSKQNAIIAVTNPIPSISKAGTICQNESCILVRNLGKEFSWLANRMSLNILAIIPVSFHHATAISKLSCKTIVNLTPKTRDIIKNYLEGAGFRKKKCIIQSENLLISNVNFIPEIQFISHRCKIHNFTFEKSEREKYINLIIIWNNFAWSFCNHLLLYNRMRNSIFVVQCIPIYFSG